jgi:ABC-type uncharacterized transport system permease subunit
MFAVRGWRVVYSGDMQADGFYVAAPFAIAVAYAGVAWGSWRALRSARSPHGAGTPSAGHPAAHAVAHCAAHPGEPGVDSGRGPALAVALLLAAAIIGHGFVLAHQVYVHGGMRFGFAVVLSATLLVACLLTWLEGFLAPLEGPRALLTPLAAVAVVLPEWFPGTVLDFPGNTPALIHTAMAVLAMSLFTLAAVLALLMAVSDRHLHHPVVRAPRPLAILLERMPSLLALETLLFRQIGAGFVLLTATLASGFVFSEELFGRPLRFEHKTVFGILAWLVFAALLTGRVAFGWRGRVAQRWVFAGSVLLILAYFGSRFVFEVVLGKGWI